MFEKLVKIFTVILPIATSCDGVTESSASKGGEMRGGLPSQCRVRR